MATGNTSQKFVATLGIFQADGVTPATVDGVPVWASSDETVIQVVPAADGMGAELLCIAPGTGVRVTVTADADLGTGVQTITGVSEDIEVTLDPAQLASVMTLTLGAPVPKA
jgi:hypothetical protein